MLSTWISLGLLILGAEAVPGGNDHKEYQPHTEVKTISVTHYVDVTIPHYITKTSTALTTTTLCFTESTTSTLHFTEYTTSTLHYTESTTSTLHFQESTTTTLYFKESTTSTHHFTVTSTETDTVSTTITNTATVSTTITNTETSTITQTSTVIFTTFDPCPTTCTVSANTVTVFFWPTDRPYSYPTTYVHPTLDYTFTSPSVYMLIDTVRGTNTLGQPAGPSTASWMLALDLEDVSTIESGTLTRQLTLSDLGTDCPQTADPSAIATLLNDSRCNPILAAPTQVRSWAYPCNACGRFGLFDPPYAVPTVTGGLVVTTPPPPPVVTTAPPVPTITPGSPSTTTTARVSPVPVPASATKASGGLLWAISAVLITVFFL